MFTARTTQGRANLQPLSTLRVRKQVRASQEDLGWPRKTPTDRQNGWSRLLSQPHLPRVVIVSWLCLPLAAQGFGQTDSLGDTQEHWPPLSEVPVLQPSSP